MTQITNIQEPPFDGQPCPMCPSDVRNLSATVHNLAWRLLNYQGGCPSKLIDKFQRMKDAVESTLLADDAPVELKRLFQTASFAATSETIEELHRYGASLKAVSDAVQPLIDKHFANRKHSHGQDEGYNATL